MVCFQKFAQQQLSQLKNAPGARDLPQRPAPVGLGPVHALCLPSSATSDPLRRDGEEHGGAQDAEQAHGDAVVEGTAGWSPIGGVEPLATLKKEVGATIIIAF